MPRKFTWPIFHQWNTLTNLQQCQRPWCCCQRVSFSFLTYCKNYCNCLPTCQPNIPLFCVTRQPDSIARLHHLRQTPVRVLHSCMVPSLKCDIHSIEKVQKKFTKRLSGCNSLPYTERRNKLNLTTLESRRLYYDLVMFLILFSWNSVNS